MFEVIGCQAMTNSLCLQADLTVCHPQLTLKMILSRSMYEEHLWPLYALGLGCSSHD